MTDLSRRRPIIFPAPKPDVPVIRIVKFMGNSLGSPQTRTIPRRKPIPMNDNHPHSASAPDDLADHDHHTSDPRPRDNKPFFTGEFGIAVGAITALLVALAVVAPDLIEDTSPDAIDWAALVVILALLAVLIRCANRRP